MSAPISDWPAIRTAHLSGGVRAVNAFEPRLVFDPPSAGSKRLETPVRSYRSLYSDLSGLGLAAVGFDFITNSLEAQSLVPTNWRPFVPLVGTLWACDDQSQLWSQLAFAAHKANNLKLWDLARRISHQLRVSAWRLREISGAYRQQLVARCGSNSFRVGERFIDGFTWLGYLSVQVFLVDACVLRDYLAEFYAGYACAQPDLVTGNITSMAGLRKKVLDRMQAGDALADQLRAATTSGGWLYEIGAYRDLVVHCVPLARSDASLFALSTELTVAGHGRLPAITFPIPKDPSSISRSRASGAHFRKDELSLLVRSNRGDAASVDGLSYAYGSLANLVKLASDLATRAPVKPEMPQLTDKDIVGEVKVKRS